MTGALLGKSLVEFFEFVKNALTQMMATAKNAELLMAP